MPLSQYDKVLNFKNSVKYNFLKNSTIYSSGCCGQYWGFIFNFHYMFPQYNKKHDFAPLSFSCSILRPNTCFHSMTKNITSLCSVSVCPSPSPVTCFHRMTKNITLLCLVSVFQSQVPLLSVKCQKTSLHCTQFQLFNPKAHYMYPMAYKLLNSIQPFMHKPCI